MTINRTLLIAICQITVLVWSSGTLTAEKPTRKTLEISNGSLTFSISAETGSLVRGRHIKKQEDFLAPSFDEYKIENKKGAKTVSEKDYSVIDVKREQSAAISSLTLTCKNESYPDALITKRYSLGSRDNKLIKRTEIKNTGSDGFFVSYHTGVSMPSSFRDTGYYYVPTRIPRLAASKVKKTRSVRSPVYYTIQQSVACLVNTKKKCGLANYIYKINDKYVSCLKSYDTSSMVFTPAGWRYCAARDYIKSGNSSAFTIHYMLFGGDSSDFLYEYLSLPEIKKSGRDYQVAPWISNVKLSMFNFKASFLAEKYVEKFKAIADGLGKDGHVMIMFNPWDKVHYPHGTYSTRHKDFRYFCERAKALRKACPRVKLGIYTLMDCIDTRGSLFKEHTDWVVWGKDGKPDMLFYKLFAKKQIGLPACRKHTIDRAVGITRDGNLDFLFMDGGTGPHGRNIRVRDWRNKAVTQWDDWNSLYKGIAKGVKELGPEKALFSNSAAARYADCSFQESSFLHRPKLNWRILSDYLYNAKISQLEPSAWISNLYWYPTKFGDQRYPNYIFALGLKPNLFFREHADLSKVTHGAKLQWPYSFVLARLPYVNAAYEMKNAMLVRAKVSPWWRRENTEIETYLLKQLNDYFVPVISHYKEKKKVKVSVDLDNGKAFKIDHSKPLFVWTESIVSPKTFIKSSRKHVFEHQRFQILHLDKASKKIKLEAECSPETLKMFVATQVPAFIYSVDKERTHLRLSGHADIKITGTFEVRQKEVKLNVESNRDSCEIMVPVPMRWGKVKVVLDGKKIDIRTLREGNHRFLLMNISRGKHDAKITAESGLISGNDASKGKQKMSTMLVIGWKDKKIVCWNGLTKEKLWEGTDAAEVLQKAIDVPDTRSVSIRGEFTISRTIKLRHNVSLIGIPKMIRVTRSWGTKLTFTGDGILFDARNQFSLHLEHLYLIGKGKAQGQTGIQCGFDGDMLDKLTVGRKYRAERTKSSFLKNVGIEGFAVGLNGGFKNEPGGWMDDSLIQRLQVFKCGIGVRNTFTQVTFSDCRFLACDIGFQAGRYANGIFQNCLWAAYNKIDVAIDTPKSRGINIISFNNCWFEGATECILKYLPTKKPGSKSYCLSPITFNSCVFHTKGERLFDFRGVAPSLIFIGSRINYDSKSKIIETDRSNGMVLAYAMVNPPRVVGCSYKLIDRYGVQESNLEVSGTLTGTGKIQQIKHNLPRKPKKVWFVPMEANVDVFENKQADNKFLYFTATKGKKFRWFAE